MCSPWTPRSRHSRRRWRRTPWTCVSPSCQHHLSGAEPKRSILKSKLIIALNLFHHLPKVFLLHLPVWMFSDEGVELFPDVLKYITVARRHSTSSLSCWPKKRKSNNTLHNLDWGFGVFNHGKECNGTSFQFLFTSSPSPLVSASMATSSSLSTGAESLLPIWFIVQNDLSMFQTSGPNAKSKRGCRLLVWNTLQAKEVATLLLNLLPFVSGAVVNLLGMYLRS